jgi:hypothetical protein
VPDNIRTPGSPPIEIPYILEPLDTEGFPIVPTDALSYTPIPFSLAPLECISCHSEAIAVDRIAQGYLCRCARCGHRWFEATPQRIP